MFKSKKNYSIIIPLFLFLLGMVLQYFLGNFPLHVFRFPINLITIIEIFILLILVYLFLKRNAIVRFLSSSYAALSSLFLFTLMVVLMVLLPQTTQHSNELSRFGFNNIVYSWSYALAVLYLLITLGLTCIRRLFPISIRNLFFFLNHFGLWMVLAFGNLGHADKISMMITVPEGELVWYGYDNEDNYIEPDFAIELNAFIIDYYPPKLALIDNQGNLASPKLYQATDLVVDKSFDIFGTNIQVLDIVEDAIFTANKIVGFSALPEKTIVAVLKINDDTAIVQNGTNFYSPVVKSFKEDYNLTLLNPEPKYFASNISLFSKTGISNQKHLIEVNKPLKINAWTVYQTSYFKTADYQSYVTVLTAVFDPWLKIVYFGFLLMFIGAIYLIFSRRIINKKIE